MRRWTVADVMTERVVSVMATATYKEIVETLQRHRISAVPVVNERGQVIGVVSEADLLPRLELPTQPVPMPWNRRGRASLDKAAAATASELMTAPAVTISRQAAITAAARIMHHQRIKRLPVVDEQSHLVGIVSRTDLLRPYLRTDDLIRAEIRDEILLRTLWIDPETVQVEVQRGVVTLTGATDRLSTADIIVRMCRGVPGVIDVVDRIVPDRDDTADLHRHNLMGATVKVMAP
jgi:CBS-domain-containing membrane protein